MSRLWKVEAHWQPARRRCLSGLADCLGKMVWSGGLSEGMFGLLVCLRKIVWSDLWSAEQMVWSSGPPDKNSSRRRRKAENCKERNNN